ncbi:MAG TPA: STAS domain-containing protein [Mycobacteriales bacterium]
MDETWSGEWVAADSSGAPGIEPLHIGARLASSHGDHCVVATVTGALDLASVTAIRDRLHGHVYAGTRHLVLDLSGVTFLDSVGLSLLIGLQRLLSGRDGTLHLAACAVPVLELLDLTRLASTFRLYDTVAEAEAASASA